MALFLRYLLLTMFGVAIQGGNPLFAKPTWTFSVVVAVEKRTADLYQLAYSKTITQIVNEQLATINANFNSSPNFNGIYNFRVDSVYVFDGAVGDEIARPHPRYMYGIVINGFSDITSGGGWYGSSQTIYHNWKWDYFDGPFAQTATDGLTHEFGHARGAIDIYALQVDAQKNPVNGTSFAAVNSIMNYPYGNVVWDEHTTNLLNATGGDPIVGDTWITDAFPNSIGIKAIDSQGKPLRNVQLDIYTVNWYSNAVTGNAIYTVITNPNGIYSFSRNPYYPLSSGFPWNIEYCNFLVKATYNSVVVYKWMPLYDVQNAYFRNGANSVYNAEIQFPASTPIITLNSVSTTSVCPGNTIDASFTVSGNFEPDNTFSLQLVDSFGMATTLASGIGTNGTTITGKIPTGYYSTKFGYLVRVVSNKPSVKSDGIVIALNALPTATLKDNGPLSGTLTSVTLTAGGGTSYAFGGLGLVSQNPTSGTAIVNASGIYSVTVTSSAGCSNTASLALAGTDLTPTLVLPQANFAAIGSVANLVVNLFEVAGLPTTMSNVAITITAPAGYTISFDPSSTRINVLGGTENPVAIDNSNWLVTSSLANRQLSLVMKANQFIGAGGKVALGFSVTRTSANSGSTSTITVNISDDATKGYDGNTANNVYARIINGL
ncbi:hypothetical protein GCM10028808_61720 [Spirosoma migulaei]